MKGQTCEPWAVAVPGTYPKEEGYKVVGPEQVNSLGHPVRYYVAQFIVEEADAVLIASAPKLKNKVAELEAAMVVAAREIQSCKDALAQCRCVGFPADDWDDRK